MVFAGALSTMNMWADRVEHMRISINDLYMILLMTGWMILFMGIYYGDVIPSVTGATLTATAIYCIRNQLFVTQDQYLRGMIPHHSMAVFMSRKLLDKPTDLRSFLSNIISTQMQEIQFMRERSKN
jgi:hypothetical protein